MYRWLRRQYRRLFPVPLPADGVIPTSITLDYRSDAWGLERIVLDSVSNHLPTDSGGSAVRVEWRSKQEWHPLPLPEKGMVGAIRISDDGPGYDAGLLGLLFSTKRDTEAVGQFGEGLKLLSAASLRNGYDVELRSQDWVARPRAKSTKVGSRNIDQLCFAVERTPWMAGSSTTFWRPDRSFIDEFRELPRKMRQFATQQQTLYTCAKGMFDDLPTGEILEPAGAPALYVRGVIVRNEIGGPGGIDALFSYDLTTRNISPDRQLVDAGTLRSSVGGLLLNCDNPEVLRRVIVAGENHQRSILEIESLGAYVPHLIRNGLNALTARWFDAFRDQYGKDALIPSADAGADEDARRMGYRVVPLQTSLRAFLLLCGVPTAVGLSTDTRHVWVDQADLTSEEQFALSDIALIHKDNQLGPIPRMRVYDRIVQIRRDNQGRAVESESVNGSLGQYSFDSGEIFLSRQILQNRREFVHTYLHEVTHHRTKARDYTREFAAGAFEIITDRFLRDHPR